MEVVFLKANQSYIENFNSGQIASFLRIFQSISYHFEAASIDFRTHCTEQTYKLQVFFVEVDY